MPDVDAVVIGAGINGLVAAAELGRAGWSVALVERNAELGGFIASAERTVPGFTHDTFSSWHPMFVSGGAYAALGADLHRLGLQYDNTDGPLCATVGENGDVVTAYRSPEQTADGFEFEEDRARYLAAIARVHDNGDVIGRLMDSGLSVPALAGGGCRLTRRLGAQETERWLRDVVTSGRGYCRREYRGTEADRLWVPWLLHAGLAPDNASGGFLLPLMAASLHGAGLPVVRGGAARFVAAFHALLDECRVRIMTGTDALGIDVTQGRVCSVSTTAGAIGVRRAVLASVTPAALYESLLPAGSVRPAVVHDARRYRFGRAAAQVHVALSAPPNWRNDSLREVPLFHVSDGSNSTAIACAQAEAGLLPSRPTIVVGQQQLLDGSRVPPGAAALWLQLQEVPFRPVADADAEIDVTSGWTAEVAQAYTRRVLARLADHAPGLSDTIVGVDILTPPDLVAHNANAVNGDPYAGSAELDQNFRWRPLIAMSPYRSGVRGLLHIGASTHPGPSLAGSSGHLAAQRLLRKSRLLHSSPIGRKRP